MSVYNVAVICGSLRKASTNAGLLRSILQKRDPRFNFQWVPIIDFPLFNEDVEVKGYPAPVQAARDQIGRSHAVLIGCPEYNYSISSPLKNAYDWLSRDDSKKYCPVTDAVGALTSSAGVSKGLRGQTAFRTSVQGRRFKLLQPSQEGELLINRFGGKHFDDNGNLINEDYLRRIPIFLNEFHKFIQENKK